MSNLDKCQILIARQLQNNAEQFNADYDLQVSEVTAHRILLQASLSAHALKPPVPASVPNVISDCCALA